MLIRSILIAACCAVLCAASVQAQVLGTDTLQADHGWFHIGYGPSSPLDVSGVVSANVATTPAVQLALNSNERLFFFGDEPPAVRAVSVSLGWTRAGRWTRVAAFVGPAFVWGRPSIDEERRELYYTGGLTANLQGFFTPIMALGIGLDLYVNVNPQMSAAGLRVVMVLEGDKNTK